MQQQELNTLDSYIGAYPAAIQTILKILRDTIRKAAPLADEAMSYGIPAFRLNNKNLVHFAAFENHIGFYPTPSGIETFKKELSKYKGAKGSVQFPIDSPIPYDLVRKIVVFRVKENLKSGKKK
jgi:uncharacterized protein YdhG (YjbR/CyaY superfamily)